MGGPCSNLLSFIQHLISSILCIYFNLETLIDTRRNKISRSSRSETKMLRMEIPITFLLCIFIIAVDSLGKYFWNHKYFFYFN